MCCLGVYVVVISSVVYLFIYYLFFIFYLFIYLFYFLTLVILLFSRIVHFDTHVPINEMKMKKY